MSTFAALPPQPPPSSELSYSPFEGSLSLESAYMASITPPKELVCPISLSLFVNPVLAPDGFTYEEKSVKEWWGSRSGTFRSPVTGEECEGGGGLGENKGIKSLCNGWLEKVDGYVSARCTVANIREKWSEECLEGKGYFLPLFTVGCATGAGRCLDGGGVAFNLIVSGRVRPDVIMRVVDSSGVCCLLGGTIDGEEVSVVDACYRNRDSSGTVLGEREEWSKLAENLGNVAVKMVVRERRRKERQREENEEWRRRQDTLRRRNIESTGINEFQGNGVGRMQNGVGYFPSIWTLQFLGSVPSGGGEEEKRRRRQIQLVMRALCFFVFAFFIFV
ncbi:hypothetical protein TrVE_jg3776 [Triparma verrucosa]|uniref:U-box domain-containing protein n=1 Tax=Triparma verrucosa TaxID=1606542 RepID=A0A9W7FMJ7_9STRA|nr:hypothetical protein TrVE_jg3776 [Triparma verrucosa]